MEHKNIKLLEQEDLDSDNIKPNLESWQQEKALASTLSSKKSLKDVRSYFGVACFVLFGPVNGPIVEITTKDWIYNKVNKIREILSNKK